MIKNNNFYISFICASNDVNSVINVNYDLIIDLSKKFKKIYILNLYRLKFFNKSSKIKKTKYKLPKNVKIILFEKKKDFFKFCSFKKLICFFNLGKSFEYFRIYRYLKLIKSVNILVLNLGNFGNKTFIDFKIKFFFKSFYHYYDRSLYYFFRILTILDYFPKIDYFFQSDIDVINNIKNGLSKKIDNFFNSKKISYYRNIIKVNSKSFDYIKDKKLKSKSKKFIIYVDIPLDHPDRTTREGSVSPEMKKKFHKDLRNFLNFLSKLMKQKIIICPHPKQKNTKKMFPNFEIAKKRTIELIPNASLVIFTESSAMTTAVLLKKKNLCIQSDLMGDYLLNLSNKYINHLNLKKINIDNFDYKKKHKNFLKKLYTKNQYNKFIKNKLNADGDIKSSKRIIDILNRKYFF